MMSIGLCTIRQLERSEPMMSIGLCTIRQLEGSEPMMSIGPCTIQTASFVFVPILHCYYSVGLQVLQGYMYSTTNTYTGI